MTDDFDPQLTDALRALEREPTSDGRAAVARHVSRRRLRRSGAAALAVVAVVGVGVVAIRDNSSGPEVIVNATTTDAGQPTPPPLAAAAAGILTFPTTVVPGDEIAAVLRNPLSSPNVACFLSVRLERWNGNAWADAALVFADGVDPNLAGSGADCAPDLILPGAFIGEQTFKIPSELAPGDYRLVDQATEGEGRITVASKGASVAKETPPVGNKTVDLAQGTDLSADSPATIDRAVVLDDNRLAVSWDSQCNAPAQRIAFDYQPDRVTAHLVVGAFLVTDCVGEPARWSTVVDLPMPLWGRDVVVENNGKTTTAERVDATPISTFVLPDSASAREASPPIDATSVFRQSPTPVSIQVDVFGARCIADAQSVVLRSETGEIFVEPHVQARTADPGESCAQYPGWRRIEAHVAVPADATFFGPTDARTP